MERRTYGQLLLEVQNELDLQNETIITDDEYVQFCNDSIQKTEGRIHDLHEDYFRTSARMKNQNGTNGLISLMSKYPLPTGIYANKIREVVFNDGDLVYEVKPYSPRKKFWKKEYMDQYYFDDNRVFWYELVNDVPYDPALPNNSNIMMEFIPIPKITGDWINIYYLRETQKIPYTANTNVYIDIPEFYDVIKFEFMAKCAFKSINPKLPKCEEWARDAVLRMTQTLACRKEDGSSRAEPDFSFYEEHA